MKGLDTLIELRERALDELRRQRVTLETQREQFLYAEQGLQNELEEEKALASEDLEMRRYFASYAKTNAEKQKALRDARARVEQQLRRLDDQLAAAFTELKKYEIAREQEQERLALEQERREQQMLDDMGIDRYLRGDE